MAESKIIPVRIPDALRSAVDAKRGNKTASNLVRELLAKWVGKPDLAEVRAAHRPKVASQ